MYYELQTLRIQAGWRIEYNNFTEYDMEIHGEADSHELCEDLLRLSYENEKLIIDLGWYPNGDVDGSYLLLFVKNPAIYFVSFYIFIRVCVKLTQETP